MRVLTFPCWLPDLQSAAVNIGLIKVKGISGGSVNFGVASIVGGAGGGGGTANQLVSIQGDCGKSWINLGLIYSVSADGAGNGEAPGASSGGEAQPAGRAGAAPATFRLRWDGQGAEIRTGEAAKGGRHARGPATAPRRAGQTLPGRTSVGEAR